MMAIQVQIDQTSSKKAVSHVMQWSNARLDLQNYKTVNMFGTARSVSLKGSIKGPEERTCIKT